MPVSFKPNNSNTYTDLYIDTHTHTHKHTHTHCICYKSRITAYVTHIEWALFVRLYIRLVSDSNKHANLLHLHYRTRRFYKNYNWPFKLRFEKGKNKKIKKFFFLFLSFMHLPNQAYLIELSRFVIYDSRLVSWAQCYQTCLSVIYKKARVFVPGKLFQPSHSLPEWSIYQVLYSRLVSCH